MAKSGGAFQVFRGRMTARGRCPRGGGGCVLANVLKAEGDDVTRAMSKGGGVLVNVFIPASGNPVSAPAP